VFAAVRAEHVRIRFDMGAGAVTPNSFAGVAGRPIYKGPVSDVTIGTAIGPLVVRLPADADLPSGETTVSFLPEHCVVGALDRRGAP
jgi:hypothetical protein